MSGYDSHSRSSQNAEIIECGLEGESRGQLTTGSEDKYMDFKYYDIPTSCDRVRLCWVVSAAEVQHPPDTEGKDRQAAAAKICTYGVRTVSRPMYLMG